MNLPLAVAVFQDRNCPFFLTAPLGGRPQQWEQLPPTPESKRHGGGWARFPVTSWFVLKGEVKRKLLPWSRKFSCFAAPLNEHDLF